MGLIDGSGYSILEKDINGDILCTWTYPSNTIQQREMMMRKCRLEGLDSNFLFGQFRRLWYYILFTDSPDSAKLPKVRQFAVCIWSAELNPEKYEAFSKIMSKNYENTGDQVAVLNIYLRVTTYGNYKGIDDSIDIKDFSESRTSNLKDIIATFGLETILIYTAVLLRKRVVVYHHNMSVLLKTVRSLPAFVSHRNLTNYLFPCFDMHKDEILNLKSCANYIAGCRDASVSSTDMFDVFVHMPAREISIAPAARESMAMTRTHKEIAFFLVQLSQNESLEERQIVTSIATKTNELLEQLQSLATVKTEEGKSMVTLESLRAKNLPHAMENFLLNLAVAEEVMML